MYKLPPRLLAILFLIACSTARGQEFFDDEPPEFLPGLIADYESASGTARRVDTDLLFNWENQAPDSRLAPGDNFSVTWNGLLQAKEPGSFQLSLFACGHVKVTLAGETLLDSDAAKPQWLQCAPVELSYGRHELQVEFQKSSEPARLGLYWSGPHFSLEPISSQHLLHKTEQSPDTSYETGRLLSRGLRCAACHEFGLAEEPLPAPALTHLKDNLHPEWLVERLTRKDPTQDSLAANLMPHFGMKTEDAVAISEALMAASAESGEPESIEPKLRAANKRRGKRKPKIRSQADVHQGEIDFVSTGCLACHQVGELGQPQTLAQELFGGGDLSELASKRTDNFLRRWLADPSQVNEHHRMPVFDLSLIERLDLAAYLATLGAEESEQPPAKGKPASQDHASVDALERGAELIAAHRCAACHQLPRSLTSPISKTRIDGSSNWERGCLGASDASSHRPGYRLTPQQRDKLRHYYTSAHPNVAAPEPRGDELLVEHNCVACHNRGLADGLKSQLPGIAKAVPELAARLAALAPPSLNSIGDKLHEKALRESILRKTPPQRPWLDVRMPKFPLDDAELSSTVGYLIDHDRIPDHEQAELEVPGDHASELAAARLVTAEGFGCMSCHQIGNSKPDNIALNAHGTDLTMLGERVRSPWFHRWVRNPSRIVPRMEMPAIDIPVKGVLHDSVDLQLAALWKTLNTPGFQPPRPNPIRIVRGHNLPQHDERAYLLTGVVETPNKKFLRPLLFGLPNRQNFLFDLEAGNLAAWWIGDAAYQHTRGKTWYWEPGTTLSIQKDGFLERVSILDGEGQRWVPRILGQFATRFDEVCHIESGITWQGRIHLAAAPSLETTPATNANPQKGSHDSSAQDIGRWIDIKQTILAVEKGPQAATRCVTEISGLDPDDRVELTTAAQWSSDPLRDGETWLADGQFSDSEIALRSSTPLQRRSEHRLAIGRGEATSDSVRWSSTYRSRLATDQFPLIDLPNRTNSPQEIDVVPGYDGIRLPLPSTEMPISFAWDQNGNFYSGSLKGRILELQDRDRDGLEESYELISDEFPTPYGLFAHEDGLDALTKFALIRLTESETGSPIRDATVVADGWGYTEDYHDWAVGLERDAEGNYYMALPCQQDDRSVAAAYLRGSALKLVPHTSDAESRQYQIEPIAAGLRFPMGIALKDDRDLFTTDNQGNYNAFNELNHLRQGKRYGFINKLENKDGFSPPFESPAISLPHPWTRSVNGICFLDTPEALQTDTPHFGPFEGHLIGCEMNNNALIRMSLQKVGDTYQGAAYLFSRSPSGDESNMAGPIVCEVSPAGDLYVGTLQDSGWSGGHNTGTVVRFRPTDNLPLGIAEVRGTATGFEIDFTQPVDASKATQAKHYAIRSYRRISTPAYGGDDQDERTERVGDIKISADRKQVTLELGALREGFVYELNLAAIGPEDTSLFPSQAHYSMRSIPSAK